MTLLLSRGGRLKSGKILLTQEAISFGSTGAATKETTHSNVPIGEAAADRIVIVGAAVYTTSGGAQMRFDRIQLDGVDMTLVENPTEGHGITALAYKAVAAGTTADIKVRVSGSAANTKSIIVWTITGWSDETPHDSSSAAQGSSNNSLSAPAITVPSGGIMLGITSKQPNQTSSFNLSGVTTTPILSASRHNAAAFEATELTGSQTLTASWSSNTINATVCALSWR